MGSVDSFSASMSSSLAHSQIACLSVIFPVSIRINRSGPSGLPRANRNGENGCITHMFCNRFTLDRHTYAAIKDVIEALLDES